MNLKDLLRMSVSNLFRRRVRTILTVMGVVIGTASIVVMISLGLGLKNSVYNEMTSSGGLTRLTVSGKDVYDIKDSSSGSNDDTYLTDEVISKFTQIPHVESAVPVYRTSALALKGNYYSYIDLIAMTPEGLDMLGIPLSEGSSMPSVNASNLELIYGNGVITSFMNKQKNTGYYETGELPDIDLMNDNIFLILDIENYSMSGSSASDESGNTVKAKKYVTKASGIVSGGPEEYNEHYYNCYCDLATLTKLLKKEFSGRVIPGQPSTKSGKPYKFFAYSNVYVKVDSMENADSVSAIIREMGYTVHSNAEYMETMKKEFAIVEAVLGGIGAISLLVAAIGIANTMMMSIYERTKEIGTFKVLGCSMSNIRSMFLIEAGCIGFLGGIVGNLLSFLLSFAINRIVGGVGGLGLTSNISYIPVWLMLLSLGFAVIIGMCAGFFPALRAMKLSPLSAIKTE